MRDRDESILTAYARGDNVRQIARDCGVAVQTVYGALARHGIEKRRECVRDKTTLAVEACRNGTGLATTAEQHGVSASTLSRALRSQAVRVKRGRPRNHPTFPYPSITEEQIPIEMKKLRAHVGRVDEDGRIQPRSLAGLKLCAPFFPNRYRARATSQRSAFEAWHDDKQYRRAVQFQIDHGDPTTPERVLRAVMLLCRTPSIFRPAVAKFIYDRYCPRDGVTWDPCVGYGGRLLGAVASGIRYIGTDVDEETVDGCRRLTAAVNANAMLHLAAAELFDPPPVNLVFTSPPYFDRERYSQNENQSWRRYKTLDAWCENFLRPVIARGASALLPDGHVVINIADLKRGSKTVPLVELTIAAAQAAGLTHTETLLMPLASAGRGTPVEPVLVFKKL